MLVRIILLLFFAFAPAASANDDVAVIIGNKNYFDHGLGVPDVDYAHNDAAAFKRYAEDALRIRPGNILDLRDATKIELERVFGNQKSHKGDLYYTVRPGESRVYIFYSGHGVPKTDGGESGYILPVDARPDRPEIEGYLFDLLIDNISELPAPQVVVFLDACFSGLSPSGSLIQSVSASFGVAIQEPAVKAQVSVLSATSFSEPQYANWLPEEKHGIFTAYLMRALAGAADQARYGNEDGTLDLLEVKNFLEQEMSYKVRRLHRRTQTPSLLGSGAVRLAQSPEDFDTGSGSEPQPSPEVFPSVVKVYPPNVGVGDQLSFVADVPERCKPTFFHLAPSNEHNEIPNLNFQTTTMPEEVTRYEISETSRYGLVVEETDEKGLHKIGYYCPTISVRQNDIQTSHDKNALITAIVEKVRRSQRQGIVRLGQKQFRFDVGSFTVR